MAATLPTKLRLEIVTPDRLLFSEEVDEVTIPGSEGYLGILPGHLPLLTLLGTGVLSYKKAGQKFSLSCSGGFAEVLPDRVIITADTVEKPEEIDVSRARLAKERAEKMLTASEADVEAAVAAMMRATSRLFVAEQK